MRKGILVIRVILKKQITLTTGKLFYIITFFVVYSNIYVENAVRRTNFKSMLGFLVWVLKMLFSTENCYKYQNILLDISTAVILSCARIIIIYQPTIKLLFLYLRVKTYTAVHKPKKPKSFMLLGANIVTKDDYFKVKPFLRPQTRFSFTCQRILSQ